MKLENQSAEIHFNNAAYNAVKNVAVLVSGGGTNLEAILQAGERGELPHVKISVVVTSNPKAYALERARLHSIPSEIITNENPLLPILKKYKIDIVVLAGFLSILDRNVISEYKNRIINVHPSLLPSFGGRGFYGLHVHEAALKRGVKISGATVHLVNEEVDGGKILAQKAVAVKDDDTSETLQRRIMEEAEWILLPRVLEDLCSSVIINHNDSD